VLAQFTVSERDVIAGLRKAGAQFKFKRTESAGAQDHNAKEPEVGLVILGKNWRGGVADLRKASGLSTLEGLYVLGQGRVSDKALEELRTIRPEIVVNRVSEASLGVRLAHTTDQTHALRIVSLLPDSPAARADFREGDVMLEFAGKPVPDLPALRALMFPLKRGQRVDVKLLREKKTFTVSVKLGDWD